MSNKVLRDYCTSIKESLKQICDENDELMAQIEKLQIEKERLRSELNIANALTENTKNKKWQPKKDEKYYYVTSIGTIGDTKNRRQSQDIWTITQGNCFKTKEETEQYRENLKTKSLLKALAEELNGNKIIDWENDDQYKYNLIYDYDEENGLYDAALWQERKCRHRSQGTIYCLDEDFVSKAIQRIGEQRLINMIKAGV